LSQVGTKYPPAFLDLETGHLSETVAY